nr:hypothetical protein CFP56_30555 [Quercus suber]
MDQASNQSPLHHPPATVVVFLSPNDLSTSATPLPAPLPSISKLHHRHNHFPMIEHRDPAKLYCQKRSSVSFPTWEFDETDLSIQDAKSKQYSGSTDVLQQQAVWGFGGFEFAEEQWRFRSKGEGNLECEMSVE